MKKEIILSASLVVLLIVSFVLKNTPVSDNIKFKEEYKTIEVTEDNKFKYVDYEKLNDILKDTGVIYFGQPDNKLSLKVVSILDKISQEYQIDINYFNVNEIKKSQEKEISKKIENFNTKGPIVVFVKKGEIIKIHSYKEDDETQKVIEEYSEYINQIFDVACSEAC